MFEAGNFTCTQSTASDEAYYRKDVGPVCEVSTVSPASAAVYSTRSVYSLNKQAVSWIKFFFDIIDGLAMFVQGMEIQHGNHEPIIIGNISTSFNNECVFDQVIDRIEYSIADVPGYKGVEGIHFFSNTTKVCDVLDLDMPNYKQVLYGENLLFLSATYNQIITQITFAFHTC